jgi:hypothetical protein
VTIVFARSDRAKSLIEKYKSHRPSKQIPIMFLMFSVREIDALLGRYADSAGTCRQPPRALIKIGCGERSSAAAIWSYAASFSLQTFLENKQWLPGSVKF